MQVSPEVTLCTWRGENHITKMLAQVDRKTIFQRLHQTELCHLQVISRKVNLLISDQPLKNQTGASSLKNIYDKNRESGQP